MMGHRVGLVAVGLWSAVGAVHAQEESHRLPLVVVPWVADASADGEASGAGAGLAHMLSWSLLEVPGIAVVGETALSLVPRPTDPSTSSRSEWLLRVGRAAEAAWVLDGEILPAAAGRQVALRVVDTADGADHARLEVTAEDWQGVREQLFDGVLRALGLPLDDAARRRALAPLARSDAAIELFGRTRVLAAGGGDGGDVSAFEGAIRAVLDEDPACIDALFSLANILRVQDRLGEAAAVAASARKIVPNDPRAEVVTALILLDQGNTIASRARLERARSAAPRWADPAHYLGRVHAMRGEWTEAIADYRVALELAPFRAGIHASLARALAMSGESARALDALETARVFDAENPDFLYEATRIYVALGMTSEALDHADHFLRRVRGLGVVEETAARIERLAAETRERLDVHTIAASAPRHIAAEDLGRELAARLSASELGLVVHPFLGDAEIDSWSARITEGIEDPMDCARRIFDVLVERKGGDGESSCRTAREVRDLWDDPSASFNCQELAKLFLALARAAEIDAYYVHLERDHADRVVYHDCAVVFVGDRAVLVDPAYRWFGPPHLQYTVLDDLQAVAHQLLQPGPDLSPELRIERCRAGVALHPDFAWARVRLATALFDAGHRQDGLAELDVAERLEPGRWDVALARGVAALLADDPDAAEPLLRAARDMNPTDPSVHRAWAELLERRGVFDQARDAYRLALRGEKDPTRIEEIRASMARAAKQMRGR